MSKTSIDHVQGCQKKIWLINLNEWDLLKIRFQVCYSLFVWTKFCYTLQILLYIALHLCENNIKKFVYIGLQKNGMYILNLWMVIVRKTIFVTLCVLEMNYIFSSLYRIYKTLMTIYRAVQNNSHTLTPTAIIIENLFLILLFLF